MTDPVAPSIPAILASLATALLPFVGGPVGLAASAMVPAVQQLLDNLMNHPADQNFTIEALVKIVREENAKALASLTAHVNALP